MVEREAYKKYLIIVVFFVELGILLFLLARIKSFSPESVDVGFSEWMSDYASYSGGFYADEETIGGKDRAFLESPPFKLQRGAYRLRVSHASSTDHTFKLTGELYGRFLEGQDFRLSHLAYNTECRFEVTETSEVSFGVHYGKNGGYIGVYDVSLLTDNAGAKRLFFTFLALFFALDLCWLFRKTIARHRFILTALLSIWVLTCVPYLMPNVFWGHDIKFHIFRIDSIGKELAKGVFPVRVADEWIYGYSYPASVMYGDFLMYPAAVLSWFGFTPLQCYKAYCFFINLLTVLTSWYCFFGITKKRREALLLTLIYVTSTYHLVTVYVRAAAGEYSAQMLLPIVALGIWRIYAENPEEKGLIDTKGVMCLGLGVAGIVCTHVLSTQMLVVSLIILALLLFRRTIKPRVLLNIGSSIVLCAAASAFFWVPFVNYYFAVDFDVEGTGLPDEIRGIQKLGAWVGELFSFFHSPFGFNDRDGSDERFMLTPGPILLVALLAAVFIWLSGRGGRLSKRLKFLVVYSFVLLSFSTTVFPWNAIIERTSIGGFFANVQFPFRYMGMALIPMVLIVWELLEMVRENHPWIEAKKPCLYAFFAATSVVMTAFLTSGCYKGMEYFKCYDIAEMNAASAVDGGEYLPLGVDPKELSPAYRTDGVSDFSILSSDGARHEVFLTALHDGAWVDFPVFAYPGYCIVDDDGVRHKGEIGEENFMLRISLKEGYSGKLRTVFVEPVLWRAAEVLSFLTLLCCAFLGLWRIRKEEISG